MPFNLPIALTWLRVAAIPLLVAIFYLPNSWFTPFEKNLIAAVIFISAAITDWLDGFLARHVQLHVFPGLVHEESWWCQERKRRGRRGD